MQGALERTPGVEEVQVDFNRREALVRFDPEEVDLQRLADAVSSAGGYQAALKYGPVKGAEALVRLQHQSESRLTAGEQFFAHTGMRILQPVQIEKTIQWLRERKGAKPEWYKEQNRDTHTLVFVSFWSKHGDVLPINWDKQVTLNAEKGGIAPMGWASLAEITESDGTGSVAGILCFPYQRKDQSVSVTLRFTGFRDDQDHYVVVK